MLVQAQGATFLFPVFPVFRPSNKIISKLMPLKRCKHLASSKLMPRKPFIQNPEAPYHIAARSNNRDWFALPLEDVWFIMSRFLYLLHHAYGVEIYAFVLMDNHFHLLARFPLGNLVQAMQYFMRETSRCIAHESRRINHVYGGRYFRCEIGNFHYFTHTYKYIYRNPVEAKLCALVELKKL